jgi:uncharacterized protein
VEVRAVETPSGPARATLDGDGPDLLVLGHGAGGGIEAPDLLAVSAALVASGWTVARVEQPYRVAGRRMAAPAPVLDDAWSAVVADLAVGRPGRVVVGGRSSGARVACRTAAATGADGVLALAFPLRPPRRRDSTRPRQDRSDELLAAGVPTLVVQGERDPFGGPGDLPAGPTVLGVPGDHSLRRLGDDTLSRVATWVTGITRA